ncbi:MAG TPA: MBL fold metallo-hydrolase, partial [Ktedonobacteraceae bacterium]|nr:MBL fold metallo-hydrolase [Ktedonobacteraceae bacterium]
QGIVRTDDELAEAVEELNRCIPDHVRRQREEARVFYASTRIANPDQVVEGEMSLDLGSVSVQVFPTPGHTATNLSIFIPSDGVLYCGDCLVSAYLPNLEEGTKTEWRTWLDSLDRIEALAPEIIVPGQWGGAAWRRDCTGVAAYTPGPYHSHPHRSCANAFEPFLLKQGAISPFVAGSRPRMLVRRNSPAGILRSVLAHPMKKRRDNARMDAGSNLRSM